MSPDRKLLIHRRQYETILGESHDRDGRISLCVTMQLLANDATGAADTLTELSAHPELPSWLRPFITALQAIVAGSRDRSLAEAPDLHYRSAAEIQHLLDILEAREPVGASGHVEPSALVGHRSAGNRPVEALDLLYRSVAEVPHLIGSREQAVTDPFVDLRAKHALVVAPFHVDDLLVSMKRQNEARSKSPS